MEFAVLFSDMFAETRAVGGIFYVAGDEGRVVAEGFFCRLSFLFVSACDDDAVAVRDEKARDGKSVPLVPPVISAVFMGIS